MALPTAEQVTNNYLYGSESKPNNILDSSILNHHSEKSDNKIHVNITEYMMEGTGRFVNSANFDIVEKFFNLDLPPGTYTKIEFLQRFGYIDPKTSKEAGNVDYSVNQIFLGTDDPDYAERAYIWGTTKFKVADSAEFIANTNGARDKVAIFFQAELIYIKTNNKNIIILLS